MVLTGRCAGTPEQILYLVQQGAIPPLCSLLSLHDAKVITVALEGLENILKVAQTANVIDRIVQIVTDCGGIPCIEGKSCHGHLNYL